MGVPAPRRHKRPEQPLLDEFLFWDSLNNLFLLELRMNTSLGTVACPESVSFLVCILSINTQRQALQQLLGLSPCLLVTVHMIAALF